MDERATSRQWVSLPPSTASVNLAVVVMNSNTGTITVNGVTATDVIGNVAGSTSQILNAGDSMTFTADGAGKWRIS